MDWCHPPFSELANSLPWRCGASSSSRLEVACLVAHASRARPHPRNTLGATSGALGVRRRRKFPTARRARRNGTGASVRRARRGSCRIWWHRKSSEHDYAPNRTPRGGATCWTRRGTRASGAVSACVGQPPAPRDLLASATGWDGDEGGMVPAGKAARARHGLCGWQHDQSACSEAPHWPLVQRGNDRGNVANAFGTRKLGTSFEPDGPHMSSVPSDLSAALRLLPAHT